MDWKLLPDLALRMIDFYLIKVLPDRFVALISNLIAQFAIGHEHPNKFRFVRIDTLGFELDQRINIVIRSFGRKEEIDLDTLISGTTDR